MRLDKLTIKDFKNLRDFTIDFDANSQTSVLVGRNGTGKSNLLEALVIIFRDLDLGERTPFAYRIEYLLKCRRVIVDWDPDRKKSLQASVDGQTASKMALAAHGERLLPRFVFGYYSGPTNRMEEHFGKHQERFYRELISLEQPASTVEHQLRPLFYARLVHSQFVLLAFFLRDDPDIRELLKTYLRIDGLDSILFVMREPPWKSRHGDERFWKAKGEVSLFLKLLYELALAPLRLTQQVPIGFRKTTKREHLYLYLKDVTRLRRLLEHYYTEQDFFTSLESTYISEVLADVRIRVKIRGVDGALTQRELSEGEQQLLMVLGLLRFTREDESLFLLDEPDTHLNPAWSLEYLDLVRKAVGGNRNSHVIMATHDPLVIAGLERSQVQIFRRDEETGQVSAAMPVRAPKGMGIAALLMSEVYGLRSQLDLETLGQLDEKRALASKERLTVEERQRLAELSEELGAIDSTVTVRDPVYSQFVEALTKWKRDQGYLAPVLTNEQRKTQREAALKILVRLKAEEPQEDGTR